MKYKIPKEHPIFKIIQHSFFVILIGFFPINLIHEYGHIAICIIDGNVPLGPFIGVRTFNALCLGDIPNQYLIDVMGGVAGFALAFSPLMLKKIRENKGIVIGLLYFVVPQFGMAIGEGFFNEWYMTATSAELTFHILGAGTIIIGVLLTLRNLKKS